MDASSVEAPPIPRCPFTNTSERVAVQAVSLQQAFNLIAQLPFFKGMGAFVDQTQLPGLYDVSFSVPRGRITQQVLLAEVEAQLGVRLRRTSMPLPILVIDAARKPKED